MKRRLSFGLVLCFGAALGCGDDGSDSTETTTPDGGGDAGDTTTTGTSTSSTGSSSGTGSTTGGSSTSSTGTGGTSSSSTTGDESSEGDAGEGGVDIVWGDGGSLSIWSPNFDDGDALPEKYTCEGETFGSGVSPKLEWSNPAVGTKRYALAFVDLTAAAGPVPKRGYHWVAYDIPLSVTGIPEELGGDAQPEELGGGTQVRGGPPTGSQNFFGPCPSWPVSVCPEGLAERSNDSYNFILYTFDDDSLEYPTEPVGEESLPQTLTAFFEAYATERAILAATSDAASIAEGAPGECPIPIPTDAGSDAGDAGDASTDEGDASTDAGDVSTDETDAGPDASSVDAGDGG